MTTRLLPASRVLSCSIISWLLALFVLAAGFPACSSEEAGTRTGNVRLTIQQAPDPPAVDMGEVDRGCRHLGG